MTVWRLVLSQVGNDWDARKRRARREADDAGSILSEEEEDRLAGLIHLDEGDNEDLELTEQAKQQLRKASALRSTDVGPSATSLLLTCFSTTYSSACCLVGKAYHASAP